MFKSSLLTVQRAIKKGNIFPEKAFPLNSLHLYMMKRCLLFLFLFTYFTSNAMFVTVSINNHVIKNSKDLKIEVMTNLNDDLILLKEEEGLLMLPSFDLNKVKTIRLFIYYKGKEYQTADISYSWVIVTGNSCSVNILTTKKAKKKLTPPEKKRNWVMVTLCCNEGYRYFNKPF
jgi:hypothetical protein